MNLISKTDKGNFIFEISKEEYENYLYKGNDWYYFKNEKIIKDTEKLYEAMEKLQKLFVNYKEVVGVFADAGLVLMELSQKTHGVVNEDN